MPASPVVRARIDPELKAEATSVLSKMGLSVSDAIRMMLVRVAAERALPFEVREPNEETREAMLEVRGHDLPKFDSVEALLADLNANEDA